MSKRQRHPDPPAYEERRIVPAPGPGLVPAGGVRWQRAMAPRGEWNALDLWADVPFDWGDITVRISIAVGSIEVPIIERYMLDCEHMTLENGRIRVLIASVRGRQCDGYVIDLLPTAGSTYTEGLLRAECWYEDSEHPSDNAGRQTVGLFARLDQGVSFTDQAIANATVQLFAPPAGQRISLTHISFCTMQGAQTEWSLETIVGAGPAVTHMYVQSQLRFGFLSDLTFPVRGQQDGIWRITPIIWAAATTVNVRGYVE